jgi:hypothetical protein
MEQLDDDIVDDKGKNNSSYEQAKIPEYGLRFNAVVL